MFTLAYLQVKEEVADPECRQVANKAYATLHRVGGEGKVTAPPPADPKIYLEALKVRSQAVENSWFTSRRIAR